MQLHKIKSSVGGMEESRYAAAREISVDFYEYQFDLKEERLDWIAGEDINRKVLFLPHFLFTVNIFYQELIIYFPTETQTQTQNQIRESV